MTDWSPMEPTYHVDDVFVLVKVYSFSLCSKVYYAVPNECKNQMYLPTFTCALFAVHSFKTSRANFISETLKVVYPVSHTYADKAF